MIAFEELSAALDRWRIRNGLPVVTGDLPMAAAPAGAPRASASYAAPAPLATRPAPAPMAAAAPAPIGESSDVLSLGDADVLEDEELYSNDGDDFAMSFAAGGGNPVGSVSGSIGGSQPHVAPPPAIAAYEDPYAAQPAGYDQAYAPPEDEYDPEAYPATPPPPTAQPGSGPHGPAGSGPYAAADSGPYGQPAGLPELYDDPAYDPPGGDTLDRPVTDGYAPPGPDTLDAEGDVIDEATVVGDDHRKR